MNQLFKNIWSYFSFAMILVGITGISWNTFSENGWIEQIWGVAWDAEIRHPILFTPIIVSTILLIILYMRGGLETGKTNRFDSLLIYITMISGVYFSCKFIYLTAW